MAPIQNFIKWLKDKTTTKSETRVSKLRQLPPIPVDKYEYGFRISSARRRSETPDLTTHIYEEIPYHIPKTGDHGNKDNDVAIATPSEPVLSNVIHPDESFDFSGAKTVGPYLIVPVRYDTPTDNKGLDLIEDLKRNKKAEFTENKSLYNLIPDWAKEHLKTSSRQRLGIACRSSRSYSVDVPPSDRPGDHRRHSNEKDTHRYHSNQDSSNHGESRHRNVKHGHNAAHLERNHGNSHSCKDFRKATKSKSGHHHGSRTNWRYHSTSVDDDEANYEYFLIKTENNLKIEQALRNYLNEPNVAMATVDTQALPIATASGLNKTVKDSVLLVHRKRSPKRNPNCDESETILCENESESDDPKVERLRNAADTLVQQLYGLHTSKPKPRTIPCTENSANQKPKHEKHVSFSDEDLHEPITDKMADKMAEQSINKMAEQSIDRFSCRVSDFQLDMIKPKYKTESHYKPEVNKPEMTSHDTSSDSADSDNSIYGSSVGPVSRRKPNRFLGDMMRQNHDRQFMHPW